MASVVGSGLMRQRRVARPASMEQQSNHPSFQHRQLSLAMPLIAYLLPLVNTIVEVEP
jgi:hypothetical protein